jgi:hypothetical protein
LNYLLEGFRLALRRHLAGKHVSLLAAVMLALAACQPSIAPTPTGTPGLSTATAMPLPSALPTAAYVEAGPFGPDSYPATINPLTGLPVDDLSVLSRAPLAVKVSNDPLSRPQSGLGSADLVFEHYAEGGVTRFTAIYYSQAPEMVGSIRSGRLLDLEIVPMFDAIFTASGFSEGVRQQVSQSTWAGRNFSGPFYVEPYLIRVQREGLALEHTMFAVPAELWGLASDLGASVPPDVTPGLAFRGQPPEGGQPASLITIDYSVPLMRAEWTYDPVTGLYSRSQAGEPQIDYLTGEAITAANVVGISAMHVETDILEDGYNGLWSIQIQLWGEGLASLYRDGQFFQGKWSRLDPEQMFQLTDVDGNTLYLKPGNTWFEIVPNGFDRFFTQP